MGIEIAIRLFLLLLAVVVAAMSIKIVRETDRVVIFRLGHLFAIQGPGVVFIIPFVDTISKIDLNTSVPNWHSLSKTELEERVKTVALSHSKR